jgi:PAS domain S-box-containing protein
MKDKADHTLSEAEIRYKALFEQSPDGILLIDTRGNILDFNETAHHQLGYSREEFAKLRIADIDPVDSQEAIQKKINEILIQGKAEHEVRHKTKRGAIRDVHVITQVLKLSGKTVFHTIWRDITEQKRAEEAIRHNEDKFRTLFDSADDAVFVLTPEGNFIDINRTAHERLGYTKHELLSMHVSQLHSRRLRGEVAQKIALVREQGHAVVESEHVKKDGTIMPVEINARFMDYSGKKVIFSIIRDITGRKKAEEELLLFRNLLNQSNDAIFVNDPATGSFLIVNDKACSNLGYDRKELLNMRTLDIEAAFPDQAAWDAHVKIVKSKGSMILEGTHKRTDGTLFPVEVNVTYMALGGTDYMVAVARDITERKQAEDALRKREMQLAESQRIAHLGSWEHNPLTGDIYWSDELFRLLGLDPEQDRADFGTFFARIHTDDQPVLKKAVEISLREKKPFDLEYRIVIAGGPVKLIHARADLVPDASGELSVLRGTGQDITERKLAEEKIRQNEQFIRSILNTVDEAFIVIDRDYRISLANNAYSEQANMPIQEITGKHCHEISHKSSRPCFESGEECAVKRCFETGEPYSCVHRHPSRDGSVLYVETKAFPLKDVSGNITSAIEVINNITDRHLLEEQILRTQKLEAVGLLAGGIAHDFNNLLQGVFGNISMAKMFSEKGGKAYVMLEGAETALYQTTNLTKQLLTFSKGGEPVRKVVALPSIIDNAVKFALSGSNVNYLSYIDEELWPIEADEGQINQVMHNIVLNAGEAMPYGGEIRMEVRNVSIDEKNGLSLAAGKYVAIVVKDSGVGIPGHYLSKIFDPYFSTKQKGSGLGLATSYSIIKRHGGVITASSHPGTGSVFSIYLPASERSPLPEEVAVKNMLNGKGRLLVMDDEEIVRTVAGYMIVSLGYDVEFAENGEQAAGKYSTAMKSGRPFDAVILDLTIRGGMGGKETIRRLAEIDPSIRAVVSSGYSGDDTLANYRDLGFQAVLSKPYQIEELSHTLHKLLRK